MKTLRTPALVGALLLCASTNYAQSIVHQPVFFQEETPLEVSEKMLSHEAINDHDQLFINHYRVGVEEKLIDMTPEKVQMKDVITLYSMAEAQRKDPSCDCTLRRCATAMRITLGLQGNQLLYFYQPVVIRLKEKQSTEFDVVVLQPSTYFRYTMNGFIPAEDTSSFHAYRSSLRVKPFRASRSFVTAAQNRLPDTRSIIYSFQEIFYLYHTTFLETPEELYQQAITFNNGAVMERRSAHNFVQRQTVRNSVFMMTAATDTEDVNSEVRILSRMPAMVGDKAANFAHLCPPKCQDVDFEPGDDSPVQIGLPALASFFARLEKSLK